MPPVLVDLFCNDLEVGKSVTMSEVGPTSAYLEHTRPLPVGAELKVQTDEGDELGAVVVRVHESVADAERSPGMYVRVVSIDGQAQDWWKKHLDSSDDPVFPERPVAGAAVSASTARTNTVDMSAEELARMVAEDRTEASAAVPVPGPPPVDESAPNARSETKAANSGGGVNTTTKMTADQVKAITDLAEKRNGTSLGMAVVVPPDETASDSTDSGETEKASKTAETAETADASNGASKPKKKRRRKKKKPT